MPYTFRHDRPPEFLTAEQIIVAHYAVMDRHAATLRGEREPGAVQSIVARVEGAYFSGGVIHDVLELAAWYGYAIVKRHAFVDGNKRTAHVVLDNYLRRYGMRARFDHDRTIEALSRCADGSWSEREFMLHVQYTLQQAGVDI